MTEEERVETRARIQYNLACMAFSNNASMSDDAVALLAAQLEKKAYDTATVQARTTTGHRPHDETLKVRMSRGPQEESARQRGEEEDTNADAGWGGMWNVAR